MTNLEGLDKAALHQVANDLGVSFDKRWKEDKVRDAITAHLAGVEMPKPQLADPKAEFDTERLEAAMPVTELTSAEPIRKAAPVVAAPVVKEPAVAVDADALRIALLPYTERGLHIVHIDHESWYFRRGKREDSGTMFQPLDKIVKCASRLVAAEKPNTTKAGFYNEG